jgi:hypothetical protein
MKHSFGRSQDDGLFWIIFMKGNNIIQVKLFFVSNNGSYE